MKPCYRGSTVSKPERCANCKFAEPIIVPLNTYVPSPKKIHGAIRQFKVLYRCMNSIRMEHFTKGTVMGSCIKCDQYIKKVT